MYCGEKLNHISTTENSSNSNSKNLLNQLRNEEDISNNKEISRQESVATTNPKIEKKQTSNNSVSSNHYINSNKKEESTTTSLPKYQYWLLISSYLLSFTYIAPIIGIIASFVAYSDIEASNHKDKDGQIGLTIGAGILHAFFIVLGIYSNGGF
jgi:hypothetical protein